MRPKPSSVRATTLVHLARVAHVASERQCAAPLRAHRVGDRLERGQAAAHRHHVGPDLGHLDGDGAADALAGPGDDGDAVLQGVLCESHRQTIAAHWPRPPIPLVYDALPMTPTRSLLCGCCASALAPVALAARRGHGPSATPPARGRHGAGAARRPGQNQGVQGYSPPSPIVSPMPGSDRPADVRGGPRCRRYQPRPDPDHGARDPRRAPDGLRASRKGGPCASRSSARATRC